MERSGCFPAKRSPTLVHCRCHTADFDMPYPTPHSPITRFCSWLHCCNRPRVLGVGAEFLDQAIDACWICDAGELFTLAARCEGCVPDDNLCNPGWLVAGYSFTAHEAGSGDWPNSGCDCRPPFLRFTPGSPGWRLGQLYKRCHQPMRLWKDR